VKAVKSISFYFAVVLIVVIAVFPVCSAIITSCMTGTALFEVNCFPTEF
jgi:trehalose/maltose transport system permease protein